MLLCAYAINNVHLMLLSGIGQPYDPVAGTEYHEQRTSDPVGTIRKAETVGDRLCLGGISNRSMRGSR